MTQYNRNYEKPPRARAGRPISLIETKTCKGRYENIVSFDNLHSVFRKAAKGKGTLIRRFADGYVLKADDSKFFHIVDHRFYRALKQLLIFVRTRHANLSERVSV